MLDVSRGILKQKVRSLNLELLTMNNRLKENNLVLKKSLLELEEYRDQVDKHKNYIKELEGIREDLNKTVGDLKTKIEDGRLKVSFKGDILFASGRHNLRPEGIKLLKSVFSILKKSSEKNDIFVAGHTDNVPIMSRFRDKYKSNWELSTYRAIEVVRFLLKEGISPDKLTAAGYGEHKPVALNDTEEGKSKNRRVELFLIPRIIRRTE
jgi:chemotaxis protein MotB